MTSAPLPDGFGLRPDASARWVAPGVLLGGSPTRVLRLSAGGERIARTLLAGARVSDPTAAALARRLTDAGLAHPIPSAGPVPSVTVLIPVRDRVAALDRCLAGLGGEYPVVVVDDASDDASGVAAVVRAHGARLVRRSVNGGPAAARNTGLGAVDTELVALLDSDCVPTPGWIPVLAGHFADPTVAAVAPRVQAEAARTPAERYGSARSSLDLGEQPARVVPLGRVSYVPTAALLVRRAALDQGAFDEALRYGEDVDLVWRLHRAGWRVRYEPAVRVGHAEPARWRELLRRRYHYGTSAGALALRHPEAMPPLVLAPWPAATVAALSARRPGMAALAFAGTVLRTGSALRRAGVPVDRLLPIAATATVRTAEGLARYTRQFAAPALVAAALLPGRQRRSAAALLLAPLLAEWGARRPALDPLRYAFAVLADDAAYGAGVLAGCRAARTTVPLRPVLTSRTRPTERRSA